MSPRHLALIAGAFVALLLLWGAAALMRGGRGTDGVAVLPALAPEAVDTVVIARPEDTTVLARRDSASWTVNGHRADGTAVTSLLEALADSARRGDVVAERSASHAGLGVDTAAGTRVRIAGERGPLAELVAGRRTPDLEGGYVRRAEDSTVYLLRGPLAGLLERRTDEWRDRQMTGVPPDSVAAVEVARGRSSYRLSRSGGSWTFGDRRAADSAAVGRLLDSYRRLDADGFASRAQADSARFQPADRRVRLLRADGTPLLTLALDSTATGTFWARVDTGSVVYRLDSWTVDRLAPEPSTLRPAPASP